MTLTHIWWSQTQVGLGNFTPLFDVCGDGRGVRQNRLLSLSWQLIEKVNTEFPTPIRRNSLTGKNVVV